MEIDRRKRQALAAGRDVIDFGVGDPDQPTLGFVVEAMQQAVPDGRHHRYAPGVGYAEFREGVAAYVARRYGVQVDPASQVLSLIGSKEGLGHLPIAVVNPGDVVLVPQPGYPVYESGTIFAGAVPVAMPLRPENHWLPDLAAIPADVRRRARVMFLNYPNNPTAATAGLEFYRRAVDFAREFDILIVHDAAYAEVYFDTPPPSILQVDGAADHAIELHSLSKTFNMTGWRVGFAIGNADAISALAAVKSNVDSGVFGAIQQASIVALDNVDRPEVAAQRQLYRRRRDVLVGGLREAGWRVSPPSGTFFVWAPCPGGATSMNAANPIHDEADAVVIPGVGFGPGGEGYLRFALTVNEERIREACARIARIRWA